MVRDDVTLEVTLIGGQRSARWYRECVACKRGLVKREATEKVRCECGNWTWE